MTAPSFIVSGTNTGIGKTVFAAALTAAVSGYYWKPVQSGTGTETDSRAVLRLAQLSEHQVLPEVYRLARPASPHIAAAAEGTRIDIRRLQDKVSG